jgi:hypothetical protein
LPWVACEFIDELYRQLPKKEAQFQIEIERACLLGDTLAFETKVRRRIAKRILEH